MLEIPGYTVSSIVYEDSYIMVAYARSERTGRTMLLKIVKEGVRATIENAKLIHEYHFLSDLDMEGLFKPVSYMSFKTMMLLKFEPIHALTARAYIRLHGSSPTALIRMLRRTARRLQELHARGILHLNIRPDTLLIQESSQDVYLTGFGYALRREQMELQGHGSLEGNPIYMSPEQTGRMAHRLDARADIYSLGMTFYELLSGQLPFTATGALQWAHAHLTLQPRPFHDADIPAWISELILTMLEKDPDDRYPSMQAIAEKIESIRLTAAGDMKPKSGESSIQHPFVPHRQQREPLPPSDIAEREAISINAASASLSGHIANYPQVLDLAAVIQASQIFTMETAMERVAERFMQLLVMNAGAHRGLMLTPQDGTWHLAAEAKFEGMHIRAAYRQTRLESAHGVNWRLLQRSAETKEIVRGASSNQEGSGLASSVLYLPILMQNQLLGVLYLENGMTAKAFAPERIHVIINIASQALFAIKAKASAQTDPALPESNGQTAGKLPARTYDLTAREKEVLRMVSKGLSNKEIAAALTITPETVKSHVKKILDKLKVDRRGKAAAVANTLGLLKDDRPFLE